MAELYILIDHPSSRINTRQPMLLIGTCDFFSNLRCMNDASVPSFPRHVKKKNQKNQKKKRICDTTSAPCHFLGSLRLAQTRQKPCGQIAEPRAAGKLSLYGFFGLCTRTPCFIKAHNAKQHGSRGYHTFKLTFLACSITRSTFQHPRQK